VLRQFFDFSKNLCFEVFSSNGIKEPTGSMYFKKIRIKKPTGFGYIKNVKKITILF
jgi:hypothetical protein